MAEANRSDPAKESRLLIRRATWCGVVFALALVITILNIVPPFAINYHVRSKLVVSNSSLIQLQAKLSHDRAALPGDQQVILVGVNVLDRSAVANEWLTTTEMDSPASELVLLEVVSIWRSTCTAQNHRKWLEAIATSGEAKPASGQLSKELRFAQWQVATAQHYVEREQFLASNGPQPSTADGITFELPTDPNRVSATLASHSTQSSHVAQAPALLETEKRLREQLAEAKAVATQLELACQDESERATGVLQIADQPKVRAHTNSVPSSMVLSVLVLALASGASAGWFQHRAQSGGPHDPGTVAAQLQRNGLPVAACLQMANDNAVSSRWLEWTTKNIVGASRRTSRNLMRISETALGFWVVFILIRVIVDPMWRTVLFESPLAALGRTLAGMP